MELRSLGERLSGAQVGLQALGLEAQMGPFLQVADAELRAARASLEGLQQATAMLVDFLCEDPEAFSLPECCGVFQAFGERFLAAAQVPCSPKAGPGSVSRMPTCAVPSQQPGRKSERTEGGRGGSS